MFRFHIGLAAVLCFFLLGQARAESPPNAAQQVLHLLDYISVEYPEFVKNGKVLDQSEYAEQVEFSGQVAESVKKLPSHPEKGALVAAAAAIAKMVADKTDGGKVGQSARNLQRNLIKAYRIRIAPDSAPDLASAAALYSSNCAACHGPAGRGDGPQSALLNPKPANFQDRARQSERSVYSLFNTISFGVEGTSMAAFSGLSADQRWALAFYVSRFASTDDERNQGKRLWDSPGARALFPGLGDIVGATPAEALRIGKSAYQLLAYLRAQPEVVTLRESASPLSVAIRKTGESVELYKQGNQELAHRAAISAYLEGFELAEASLDRTDRDMRKRIEQEMMDYRNLIKNAAPAGTVEEKALAVTQSLEDAAALASRSKLSAASAFTSAFVVIVREGIEAILILAAIAAFLIKSGRREGLVYVHVGWAAALLLGAVTWIASATLIEISGAERETTEGLTALLSAAVLLYAGYWLHRRSYVLRWQSFIRGQIGGALSTRTLSALTLISFLAVYREVFETVLFMQALWVQQDAASRGGLIAGVATAGIVLTVLAWLISRYSARLRFGLFFSLSSLLMAALAIIFAGKGVAALQAAGKLPMDPLAISGIPSLGIYPSAQGLVLQSVLITAILASFLYSRAAARRNRHV